MSIYWASPENKFLLELYSWCSTAGFMWGRNNFLHSGWYRAKFWICVDHSRPLSVSYLTFAGTVLSLMASFDVVLLPSPPNGHSGFSLWLQSLMCLRGRESVLHGRGRAAAVEQHVLCLNTPDNVTLQLLLLNRETVLMCALCFAQAEHKMNYWSGWWFWFFCQAVPSHWCWKQGHLIKEINNCKFLLHPGEIKWHRCWERIWKTPKMWDYSLLRLT